MVGQKSRNGMLNPWRRKHLSPKNGPALLLGRGGGRWPTGKPFVALEEEL